MFCSQCGTELNTDANYCAKCGKPVSDQSQSAAPSTVDSAIPLQHQLEPAQYQFKMKGFITRARNGKERLWIVFWVYIVLGAIFFRLLFPVISAMRSPVGGVFTGPYISS